MTRAADFGTLIDHATGDVIRPATAGEWRRCASACHASPWNGIFELDGCAVRVDGGPDMNPHRDAIIALRSEAGSAGDLEMAAIADRALLSQDDAAWGECVRVILDNRMESA